MKKVFHVDTFLWEYISETVNIQFITKQGGQMTHTPFFILTHPPILRNRMAEYSTILFVLLQSSPLMVGVILPVTYNHMVEEV